MKYKDLFVDFDDTLYDTHGNAAIALTETFREFRLDRLFADPQVFYDAYWTANIDLWTRYSRGEISRDFLIVERFRRPLAQGSAGVPARKKTAGLPAPMMGSAGVPARKECAAIHSQEEETTVFCLQMNDYFLDRCSEKPGVVDGAHELMEHLAARGYRMHLCSNGFHEVQYKKLDACGMRHYFTTIILSEDAGANKPSPQFFDYALRQAAAQRATTLMIGDNLQTDILGAKAAGIDTLFFNRYPEHEKSREATYTVTSLRDIQAIL